MVVTYRLSPESLLRFSNDLDIPELVVDTFFYAIGLAEACPDLATIQMTRYKR